VLVGFIVHDISDVSKSRRKKSPSRIHAIYDTKKIGRS
jgi:hypothetical protein